MTRKRLPSVQLLTACGLLGLGLMLAARPAPSAPPSTKPKFTYQSLGTLGGATSTAEGLNDFGDVVGVSDLAGGGSAPYVWTAGEGMQDLNVVTDSPLDVPNQPRFGPDRNGDDVEDLYVVSQGSFHGGGAHVDVFDGLDGHYVERFISSASGGLSATAWLYIAPDGNFYIPSAPSGATESGRDRVLRFDSNGNFVDEFVNHLANGGLAGASGLTFGADVNNDEVSDLFVAGALSDNVVAYSGVDGSYIRVFIEAGYGGMDRPGDLLLKDIDGDDAPDLMIVSTRINNTALAYNYADGSFIGVFVPPDPSVTGGWAQMAIGPDGDLYAAGTSPISTNEGQSDRAQVYRFDGQTGGLVEVFVLPGSGGLSSAAPFMVFDSNGDLYVSSGDTNQILKYEGPLAASPGDFTEVFVSGVGYLFQDAHDVNNVGQIVGVGRPRGRRGVEGEVAAYRYTPPGPGDEIGTAIDLGLPGYTAEEATGINDNGDVAGHFLSPVDGKYHAFLWSEAAGAIDLGTLSGQNTFVTAITNRTGGHVQISGYASTSSGDRAWRYNTATGVMQNLGLISGSSGASRAWDINDAGTAAGHASAGSKTHAFTRTLSGGMVDLGTLGGNNSYAAGINDLNTVVGMSDTSTKAAQNKFQAFMRTTAAGIFKLEPQITNLPGSMQLKIRPTRVSDAGQVIGPGAFDPAGTAFVLTPQ